MNNIQKPLEEKEFEQLFQYWNQLSKDEQDKLIAQIKKIDLPLLIKQKELLKQPQAKELAFESFLDYAYAGNEENLIKGQKIIAEGQVGCLILAGGQGTRLNTKLPKGMFPVSLIKQKTLFQIFSEKVLAASKQAGRPLSLVIMTSPLNDQTIKDFFIKNHYFGLNEDQVSFYSQGMLPQLNEKGELFLENKGQLSLGPNGNGFALKEFYQSGIWSKWHQKGIRYLNMILIDNPLSDPFDAELVGYHASQGVDVTSKSIEKTDPQEKMGVFVKQGKKSLVVEYSELSETEKVAKAADGHLKHRCANLSQFCLSMDFIKHTSDKDLPLHLAKKALDYVDDHGKVVHPEKPNAWKFEAFIFDNLQYTNKVAALLYKREDCFAPLKNGSGDNSITTVQEALQAKERDIIKKITGKEPPNESFELAADFYYPTPELLSKWKGKSISKGYIEP